MRRITSLFVHAAALSATLFAGLAVRECPGAGSADAAEPAAKRPRKIAQLRVRRVTPRHGAKFVDLAAEVTILFNRPVDPETVNARNVVVGPLLAERGVEWTARFESGGRRVVIVPTQPLLPGTDYQVVVGRGVADTSESFLPRERRSLFFTDPRFSPYALLRPDQFEDLEERMSEPRAAHSATIVAGGRVLLAGGLRDQYALAAGADIYDPPTKSFRIASSLLRRPRAYHPTIGVGSGSAVLIGGWDGNGATATTEFYDRNLGDLRPAPDMLEARDFHAAVALADGRILVTGGGAHTADGGFVRSSVAEILDFDYQWRATKGKPIRRRAGHTLTLLADGTVLVTGGQSSLSGQSPAGEIFDPVTETFRLVPNPPHDHRQLHTAVAIDGGERVLLADGGDPILDVYDPATERFFPAGGSSFARRTRATATALPWGDVILAGGFESRGSETIILSSIDLYVRNAGDWGKVFSTSVVFSEPRAGHTATSLDDGRVLFAGGFTNDESLDSAVLFTPEAPKPGK